MTKTTYADVPIGASTASLLNRGIRPDAAYVVESAKHWLNGSPNKHPLGTTVIGWSVGNHIARAIHNVTSDIFPEKLFFWLDGTTKILMDQAASRGVAAVLTFLLARYVPGSMGEGIRFAALPYFANSLEDAGRALLDAPGAEQQSVSDKAGRVLLATWALLNGLAVQMYLEPRNPQVER